jgi:ADP-heptose:LPS heptosyltransferase
MNNMSKTQETERNKYQSILVIKLGALGDFMQAMGAFKAVRSEHLTAKITLLTTKPFEGLANDCGYFDHVQIDERPKWWQFKKLAYLRTFLNTAGHDGAPFERVYDMQNNDRSKGYHKLTARKTEWVGTAMGASHQDPASKDARRDTMSHGGLRNIEIDQLEWMKGDITALNLPEKFVIIVSGCAPTRPEKRWVTERYIELCEYIADLGYIPVLIGTDAEKEITSEIASGCTRTVNLTGKTKLYDIAELGRKATAAIGNDTGPMHILGPIGCPLAVMYPGSSNAVRYKPLGKHVHTLQKEHMNDITLDDSKELLSRILEH